MRAYQRGSLELGNRKAVQIRERFCVTRGILLTLTLLAGQTQASLTMEELAQSGWDLMQ